MTHFGKNRQQRVACYYLSFDYTGETESNDWALGCFWTWAWGELKGGEEKDLSCFKAVVSRGSISIWIDSSSSLETRIESNKVRIFLLFWDDEESWSMACVWRLRIINFWNGWSAQDSESSLNSNALGRNAGSLGCSRSGRDAAWELQIMALTEIRRFYYYPLHSKLQSEINLVE